MKGGKVTKDAPAGGILTADFLRPVEDVQIERAERLVIPRHEAPQQAPALQLSAEESRNADLALRNINPYRYKFYDDPKKNASAQAFVESYKEMCSNEGLSGTFQKAVETWNKENSAQIDAEYIKSCVGDQGKAATKKEYFSAMAEHAPDRSDRIKYAAKAKLQLTDTKIDVSRDAIDPEKSALKNLDPIKYNFYEDPERNKNARAYVEIYKEVSKATDHDAALTESLVQRAWEKKFGTPPDGSIKKGSQYDISIEHIKTCISDPTKAVSRSEYYSEVAAQSPPVGRIVFSAAAKALPEGSVDVAKDYKHVDANESTIERLSKVNVDFPVVGKVNAGKILKGVAIAGSTAVAATSIAMSGGAALPIALPILSATCSAVGIGAGVLSATHDELKEKEDTRKFLSDAIEVQKAADIDGKTPNPVAREKAENLIDNIIGDSIDKAVDLHQNGRDISRREWALFALNTGLAVASVATAGVSSVATDSMKLGVDVAKSTVSGGIIGDSVGEFVADNIEQTQRNNSQKERAAKYAVELTELNESLGKPVELDRKVTSLHKSFAAKQSASEGGVLNLSSLEFDDDLLGTPISSVGSFSSNASIETQAAGRPGNLPRALDPFDEDDLLGVPTKTVTALQQQQMQRVDTQPKLLDPFNDDLFDSPATSSSTKVPNPLEIFARAGTKSEHSPSATKAAAIEPEMGMLRMASVSKQASIESQGRPAQKLTAVEAGIL